MPEPIRDTAVRWPVPIALAVPALAAAVTVTFTVGHSAAFGFYAFGAFAVLTAAAAAIGAAVLPGGRARRASVLKAIVAVLGAGAAVIVIALRAGDGGTPLGAASSASQDALALSITVASAFLLLAAIDLTLGVRSRRTDRFARDWIAVGTIEALGAIAILIVPSSFYQPFSFAEKTGEIISGAVTASTMIVGLFGAAAAILGVFLIIAGIGLVPSRERSRRAAA